MVEKGMSANQSNFQIHSSSGPADGSSRRNKVDLIDDISFTGSSRPNGFENGCGSKINRAFTALEGWVGAQFYGHLICAQAGLVVRDAWTDVRLLISTGYMKAPRERQR